MATVTPTLKRRKPRSGSIGRASSTKGPSVIPYGRFSDDRQRGGGSKRRQHGDDSEESRSRRYAEKIGLPYNESLSMFDEALSGYHGEHVAKGALGRFLNGVEAKLIPKGSILWVESIDRLTRQNPLKGMKMILFGIIEHGVGIYVDDLHELYDLSNVDDKLGELYGEIKRAHRESKRKSDLALAAWKQKRDDVRKQGGLLDSKIPHWLKVVDGKFVIRKNAKEALTMLLKLKEKDKSTGAKTIARTLNRKCRWKPTGGWTEQYVFRCLRNRALIGEKQPGQLVGGKLGERVAVGETLSNYYPPAVDRSLFLRVQQIIKERASDSKGGGRNDKCRNVLQSLCQCGYCGGPIYLKSRPGSNTLYCKHGLDGLRECKCPEFHYDVCEDAVLNYCQRLEVDQIIPSNDAQTKLNRALRRQVQRTSAELEDIQNRIANLDDQLERTKNPKRRDHYEQRINKLDGEKGTKEKELAKQQSELTKAERKQSDFTDWKAGLATLRKALDKPDVRRRLNYHLREIIDRIEVFSKGRTEDDGDDFRSYFHAVDYEAFPEGRDTSRGQRKRESELVEWALAERRTKRGRFLRIHFKGPRPFKLDVVPHGSIAGRPDLDELMTLFKASKRRRVRKTG